jgi:predicted hotdog family 3-hydroxylacyl-ACP dehydratase
MPMNRAWIEARIPHQGRMCLLDEVLDWNAQHIRCRSATHRALDNPLRSHGRLGIACGIEYAAQAMALHGALADGALADGATEGGAVADGAADRAAKDAVDGGVAAIAVSPSRVGLLASVRDVRLNVLQLDDIESDLICEVKHLAGDSRTALYEFALYEFALYEFALYEFGLHDLDRSLISGRASVILDADGRLKYE